MRRGRLDVAEPTVDAESHTKRRDAAAAIDVARGEAGGVRLEVNVGGAVLDGEIEVVIERAHCRRGFGCRPHRTGVLASRAAAQSHACNGRGFLVGVDIAVMKAIVIPKFGGADVLELREVPEPACGQSPPWRRSAEAG